jgi:hypothetical protein
LLQLVITEPEPEQTTFADFWTLWPKRVARLEAEKAWKKLTAAQHVEALTALCSWRSVWINEGRGQFVPHAATWLNGWRWEDELPENWIASHSSHLPAKPPLTERSEMPQHVKDAIARLRK